MDTDVVHEHDVASLQGRSEKLFGIGLEHLAGHRPFEHEGRGNTIMTQRSDESDGFPIAVWHLLDKPFALRRPSVEAGYHGGVVGVLTYNKPPPFTGSVSVSRRPYVRRTPPPHAPRT